MIPQLAPYLPGFAAVLVAVLVQWVLVFVSAAVTNGKNLHAGLTPTDIGTFPFRAFRAHHNAIENTPVFAATMMLAAVLAANPTWVNVSAGIYLLARVLHPAFYYAAIAPARTGAFGIGLLAWLSMIVAGLAAAAG